MPYYYGKKVMLREYRESDFEKIRKWVNNPEVVVYLSDIFLYPQSEKETEDFMERTMSSNWKGFVIADRVTEEYIGQVDFVNLDQKNGFGELGIVIGDLEKTSKGYGSEAIELFLDFAFNQLRLNRIELVCWSYNKRAQKAYEKVGFVKEGISREKRFINGSYHDEFSYGILREEWEKRKQQD